MIDLSEATKNWARDGEWRIAPAGVAWIAEGARVSIGEGSSIGANSDESIDLGWADGYRKCIAVVNGVAYIGAGCLWVTLADALKHWGAREDRTMTMCLMQSAIAIAALKGWSQS